MSENDLPVSIQPQVQNDQDSLKYLDAVQKAAQTAVPYVSKAYDYAKENSGSLKPVVETASGLTKTALAKMEPTAKELLVKYEPVAEQHAASAWQSLNKMPLFRSVAKAVIPTASYVSEKYNQTVQQTTEEGYTVSSYLPRVPTEKIAKVFKAPEPEAEAEAEEEQEEPAVRGGDEGAVVPR